jgi:hypothetical protein
MSLPIRGDPRPLGSLFFHPKSPKIAFFLNISRGNYNFPARERSGEQGSGDAGETLQSWSRSRFFPCHPAPPPLRAGWARPLGRHAEARCQAGLARHARRRLAHALCGLRATGDDGAAGELASRPFDAAAAMQVGRLELVSPTARCAIKHLASILA